MHTPLLAGGCANDSDSSKQRAGYMYWNTWVQHYSEALVVTNNRFTELAHLSLK